MRRQVVSETLRDVAPDHFYKVHVSGYVFVKLPAGTPEDVVIWKACEMAEDGVFDATNAVIEEEFDD